MWGEHVPQSVTSSSYAWMLDLLYGGRSSVTWATAGSLPVGYDRADQLAQLPSAPGRSFLVSLASRSGAASALTSYNALRSGRRKMARHVLGSALRVGLAQPLLRDRVDIGVRAAAIPEQRSADLLTEHLRRVCASAHPAPERLVTAISGGEGPYRKPVLQVFSRTGAPLGFVKVGWNEWTKAGVRQESAVLRAHRARPREFAVPRLLSLSDWHGLSLLATAPLPEHISGISTASAPPATAVLREITRLSNISAETLAGSSWWRTVKVRIRDVADPVSREALTRTAERLLAAYGEVVLEFGFFHGDLTPWNLGSADGQLYIWDWESSGPDTPVGFDAVHYHFQVSFVGQHHPLEVATAIAAQSARPALRELGVPAEYCGLITVLHLIELFLRHEAARSATGLCDLRFYPSITTVLEQRQADICGMAPGYVGEVS